MNTLLHPKTKLHCSALLIFIFISSFTHAQLLKVGVAGLSHDHAHSIMQQYKKGEVILLGIAEADANLIERYKKQYQVPDSLFHKDLTTMLQRIKKPDAVLAYNAISEHLGVVEICAPKGIPVMVEKPLAVSVKQAERMKALANQYKIQLLTNYETTWYDSNQQVYSLVEENEIGPIRKMVVHDGHGGPKEIGCSKEFLAWLTDPEKNGGGAIIDFGCYGANLMTWLMNGKAPIAVTAITRHYKPDIYPKVDDDATIMLEYDGAIGIIEASWNWPFGIKDMEVFGVDGYLHALNKSTLQERKKTAAYTEIPNKPAAYTDNLVYLAAVLRGTIKSENDLSSLNNNMIVVRILEAAKESAKDGRRVVMGNL